MKKAEIQGKTKEELQEMLRKEQAELVKTRFAINSRQERNYKKVGQIRKNIARLKTRLRELEKVEA